MRRRAGLARGAARSRSPSASAYSLDAVRRHRLGRRRQRVQPGHADLRRDQACMEIATLAAHRGIAVYPHVGGPTIIGLAANLHWAVAADVPWMEYDIDPWQPLVTDIGGRADRPRRHRRWRSSRARRARARRSRCPTTSPSGSHTFPVTRLRRGVPRPREGQVAIVMVDQAAIRTGRRRRAARPRRQQGVHARAHPAHRHRVGRYRRARRQLHRRSSARPVAASRRSCASSPTSTSRPPAACSSTANPARRARAQPPARHRVPGRARCCRGGRVRDNIRLALQATRTRTAQAGTIERADRARRADRLRAGPAGAALGRHAPARGDRPCPRHRPRRAAARRAVRRARRG